MRFTGPRHIALLDGLRGYAAFVVVLYHLRHFFGDALPVANGYLAVDLFFVMSGLVIAMTYEARLRAGMGVAAFFRRRVIRLYPVYAIGGLLGVAVMLALPEKRMGAGYALSALVSQAAMLPEALVRGADGPFPLNPPAWSLFFEIWGNLAFALLVPRLPTRWLAATVGLALIGYVLGSRAAGTVELGVNYARLAGGAARFWFGFGLGVLIWRLEAHLPHPGWGAVVLAMLFPALPESDLLRFLWIALIMPAGVLAALRLPAPQALCRPLGVLSYPLYLLHWPVMVLFSSYGLRAEGGSAWRDPWLGAAIVLASCALTAAVAYGAEPRLRATLERLIPSR